MQRIKFPGAEDTNKPFAIGGVTCSADSDVVAEILCCA